MSSKSKETINLPVTLNLDLSIIVLSRKKTPKSFAQIALQLGPSRRPVTRHPDRGNSFTSMSGGSDIGWREHEVVFQAIKRCRVKILECITPDNSISLFAVFRQGTNAREVSIGGQSNALSRGCRG